MLWLRNGALAVLLAALSTASTLTPPTLPLVVRNPYLSTWLQNARDSPWQHWPMFYTGQDVGMSILASVRDASTVYPLLGRPQDSLSSSDSHYYNISYPEFVGTNYDASTTNFTYYIPSPSKKGQHAIVIVSFLSPITPTSTLRQSIPASYVSIIAEGNFDIDVYMDLNGMWVSGDRNSNIEWEFLEASASDGQSLRSWKVSKQQQQRFVEFQDRSEWGTLYFTGPGDARYECGTSAVLRRRFSKTGTLQNHEDRSYRSIMDEEPVFAFSKSFELAGNSTGSKKSSSVLFTIAHVQEEVVQFAAARGMTFMRPLWSSYFFTHQSLIMFHYLDYDNSKALAGNYSSQLAYDAAKSDGPDYEQIVALSARQVLGATSFSGTPQDPLIFLKEISSNGNCQTVDVIFPSFPFFLYTNPRWLAYLLEPLLEHQLSGQYPNKYSMHDLGFHFPNMTGHPLGRDEYMPVEECGDMLIMGLALVNSLQYESSSEAQSIWSTDGNDEWQPTSDGSVFALSSLETRGGVSYLDDRWGGPSKGEHQAKKWLEKSYKMWKQWSEYLIDYSLEPENQLSTDDFAGWLKLQTNLALKGIIGINAMSHLSAIMELGGDEKYYRNISHTYIKKWQEYGLTRDHHHAKLAYNWYGSWTTLYSLFADAVLCFHPNVDDASAPGDVASFSKLELRSVQNPVDSPNKHRKPENFIPHSLYLNQSEHYAIVMQKYGLPLDSRHLYTKSDWEFEAAAVASPSVRRDIIERVAKWINETVTDRPFTDLYVTEDQGQFPGPNFFARPVVGGHFSFLTLERACGGKAMQAFREG